MSTSDPSIAIITDSSAHFPVGNAPPHVIIVPNRLTIAGRVYRENVDLSPEEGLRLMAHQPFAPLLQAPTAADFQEAFDRASRTHDAIISIHTSREINDSWAHGKAAAQALAGHSPIEVIDSATLTTAQALLVLFASQLVELRLDFEEVVRQVRSAVERTYAVFYVENADYLIQNHIMSASHGVLSALLTIKPFVTIENGRFNVIEKVRTRIQAIEKLVEFASEFTDVQYGHILQHKTHHNDSTRMLQDRLSLVFPDRSFPPVLYGASLAALIGTDATGLVILENEPESED